jgi:hypothetical protein
MNEQAQGHALEARWPVVLTVVAVIALLAVLPQRISLSPWWMPYIAGIAVLIPILAVGLTDGGGWYPGLERMVIRIFFIYAMVATFATLANLMNAMVHHTAEVEGIQLLESSVAIWISNVLTFSLLYWQMDRGGPEARTEGAIPPDWRFPQDETSMSEVGLDWRPTFIDYLYLAFSTATAFSTTDAMPLSSRAKLLMMLESTISLTTILIVASRAINILGAPAAS